MWDSFKVIKNRLEGKYIFICKIEFMGGSVIYIYNIDLRLI